MLENFLLIAIFVAISAWTLTQSIRELLRTRKDKRPYQNQDLQPLLGVVWPEEPKKKKTLKKDK